LEKFAMDAGSSPEAIFCLYPSDQASDFGADFWLSTLAVAKTPLPKEAEANPVPGDDRLGFCQEECISPVRLEMAQHDPEDPIHAPQLVQGNGLQR
jgi:hypothetical protein